MRYCSECGTLNDTEAKFCAHCGRKFDGTLPKAPDAENIDNTDTEVAMTETTEGKKSIRQERPVKGRVFGIIGFVGSVDSIFGCLIPVVNIITLIESIISLVFCNISKKHTSFRLANVGRTLSIIALVFSVVTIIIYAVLVGLGIVTFINDPDIQNFLDEITANGITITFN